MADVFLLLGSNLGNREMLLMQAIEGIENRVGRVEKKSAVYETLAWGKTDEPDYLNQVLQVKTQMDPQAVLSTILTIELDMGRERKEKWGSRTIDIDILLYDNEIINQPDLVVPHPQMHNRRFTLDPLAEIAPNLNHPVLLKSFKTLQAELNSLN